MIYVTRGMTSGACRHLHPTLTAAEACRRKYLTTHPLSDRYVMRLEENQPVLLTWDESLELGRSDPPRHKT